jgi:hypothetical protein
MRRVDEPSLHLLAVRANVQLLGIFIRVWKNLFPCKGRVVRVLLLLQLLLVVQAHAIATATISSIFLWVHHHHWRVLLEKSLGWRGWLVYVWASSALIWHVLTLVEWTVLNVASAAHLSWTASSPWTCISLANLIINSTSTLDHRKLAPLNHKKSQ